MIDREKVIKGLEHCSEDGCKDCPYESDCTMCDGFSILAKDALALLKEESIPVSWLKEKLVDHPELSYADADGINAVLNLWEMRDNE